MIGNRYAALRYSDWKITFLKQTAQELASCWNPLCHAGALQSAERSDPSSPSTTITGIPRWYLVHMFAIAPAGAYVGQWLQSFREFPPRQKPGSFNLDRVMEAVTAPQGGKRD